MSKTTRGSLTCFCFLLVLPLTAQAQLVNSEGVDLLEIDVVYTLTNLHPDEVRRRLYAVNYQQPGLIPRCTAVKLTRLRRNELNFEVIESERGYEYLNHDAAAEPFESHLLRFFGAQCDPADVGRLSDIDRQGVRSGSVLPGMSRQGVIYALGYPPRHVNPSVEFGDWRYWSSRFDTFIVMFDANGVVVGTRD